MTDLLVGCKQRLAGAPRAFFLFYASLLISLGIISIVVGLFGGSVIMLGIIWSIILGIIYK